MSKRNPNPPSYVLLIIGIVLCFGDFAVSGIILHRLPSIFCAIGMGVMVLALIVQMAED